jgi:hypothetical protein
MKNEGLEDIEMKTEAAQLRILKIAIDHYLNQEVECCDFCAAVKKLETLVGRVNLRELSKIYSQHDPDESPEEKPIIH